MMSAVVWPLMFIALGVTGIGVTLWRMGRPPKTPRDQIRSSKPLELDELEELLEVSAGTLRIDVTYHAPLPGQSTSKVTVAATSLPPAFKRHGETELLPEYCNTWTVWGEAPELAESVYEEIAELVVAWSGPAERAQQSLAERRREVQALELDVVDVDLGGGD